MRHLLRHALYRVLPPLADRTVIRAKQWVSARRSKAPSHVAEDVGGKSANLHAS
jgi:hypothetical protein